VLKYKRIICKRKKTVVNKNIFFQQTTIYDKYVLEIVDRGTPEVFLQHCCVGTTALILLKIIIAISYLKCP
jgi:hypothetical protein